MARLKEDGGLDRSFGEKNFHGPGRTGKRVTGPRGMGASAFDLATLRSRIVAVGTTNAHDDDDFALVRLQRNGRLDDSFSGNGTQTTAFGPGDEVAYDVAFQSRRKFIVAGVISPGDLTDPAQDFLIARYKSNGELDD